jgi:hypothetical protein
MDLTFGGFKIILTLMVGLAAMTDRKHLSRIKSVLLGLALRKWTINNVPPGVVVVFCYFKQVPFGT